jgi:hypothetical protein
MANKLIEERLVDSNKRALLKYVYISDGTAEANTLLIDTSSLAFSMNANNQIMASNTHAKEAYRVNVKRIAGSAKVNSAVSLIWASASNTEFATIQTGTFDYSFGSSGSGGGVIVNPMASGANGDILITFRTPAAGDSFTLFVELVKNGSDYDQGQTADPIAFNRET